MPDSLENLRKDVVTSIASVITLLRNAIAAALPVAPDQYLTIAIPGTAIDLADYEKGGSYVYDGVKHARTPTTIRQSEARLVDGMMPIADIMVEITPRIREKMSPCSYCLGWEFGQKRCSQLLVHA